MRRVSTGGGFFMSQSVGQSEEAGKLIVFDLRQLTQLREDGPFMRVLSDIGTARIVLFAFKAGQQLKEHKTSSQIMVQVLRGRVTFTGAGSSVKVQAGMVLQLEAHTPHSVIAQTDAVMLVTMVPSPSYHSLPDQERSHDLTPLVARTNNSQSEST